MDIDIYFEKMSLISLVSFMVDFVYIYFFLLLTYVYLSLFLLMCGAFSLSIYGCCSIYILIMKNKIMIV